MTKTEIAKIRYIREEQHVEALAKCGKHAERVAYALGHMPRGHVKTELVVRWLDTHGWTIARQTVSPIVTDYRAEMRMADTGEQEAMTAEVLSTLDAMPTVTPAERQPSRPDADLPAELVASVPPVATPTPRQADAAPVTPDVSPVAVATPPATAPKRRGPSWRGRLWAWAIGKVIWALYMGLLSFAAYGLFEVLREGANSPLPMAIIGAASIELIGISTKVLADRAAESGEVQWVVRSLLAFSGAVALGVAVTNLWGHAHLSGPISAAVYGLASIAGYALWTITTSLAHRAQQRAAGQLEGPGLRIPTYITERYGRAVAVRAQRISRLHPDMSLRALTAQARDELAVEAREAREVTRRDALRAALTAQARATHTDPLAAQLDISQYNPDTLSDMMSATEAGHRAKAVALVQWMESYKTPDVS